MSSARQRILVAMSGGVDSSVAALQLVREGHEVIGCFMRLGSPGDELIEDGACTVRVGHQGCCSINDAADARTVAGVLGIPFYVCNFREDFSAIIDHFVAEYNGGRTPNPCIRCNDRLKFGKLHDYARQLDAHRMASGHYARIETDASGNPRLRRGTDLSKDQSYVLFGASRDRRAEMVLPIGHLPKSEVRRIAQEAGLPVFDKPDSQEICFVPDNDYAALVARRSPGRVREGLILDLSGRILGSHRGHQHFTIGQRHGLGVALGQPVYVVSKNAKTNEVTVGARDALMARACRARECTWHEEIGDWRRCLAKIRYNAAPVPAIVRRAGDGSMEVRFDEAQAAVAPGQAVVCYEDDVVLAGGWIEEAEPVAPR